MDPLRTAFEDWREWLPELVAIVVDAGVVASRLFEVQRRGGDVGLTRKRDASPLTEADRRAHEIIVTRLARLTPGLRIVSEEDASEDRRPPGPGDAPWWLVDPLDGTREFVSGHPEFTVNVGLVLGGRPVFGIVSVPMLGQIFWGAPGQGAWLEDSDGRRDIRCASVPSQAENGLFERPLRILASRQHLTPATERWIARHEPHVVTRYGSSLKFCRLAEGEGDCYPRLGPTAPWDTAAAQAVVEGAGGRVVVADGSPLAYDGSRELNPDFLVLGDVTGCANPPHL